MSILDIRYDLEEEIRTLSSQCKCRSYDGPCRACMKAEKLTAKLDKMQAEDEVVRSIAVYLREHAGPGADHYHYFRMAADVVESGKWRKKTEKSA